MEHTTEKEIKKRGRWGWIAGGVLLLLLAAAYLGVGIYFQSHFGFHTWIDGIDISKKTVEEVEHLISQEISAYELNITGREGTDETISGTAIDIHPVFSGEIEALKSGQNGFAWAATLFRKTEWTLDKVVAYDETALENELSALSCVKNGRTPVDAACSDYVAGTGYSLIPADYGTKIDENKLSQKVDEAVMTLRGSLDLEEEECYIAPEIGDDDEKLLASIDSLNRYAGVNITYDFGEKQEVLDGERIHEWLSLDADGTVQVDEEGVLTFVKELASAYNTAYQPKTFRTSYGSTVTITGGAYGWKIDNAGEVEQILSDLAAGEDTEREPVYSLRANSHGENDYGNSYVEINITMQHLFVYKDGVLVVESDFVSGNIADGHGTPNGAFPVTYTTTNAVLRGATYETPVSFWMPFNGDIGMHDATWRKTFGGNIYKMNGSHGCINLPYSVAEKIYNTIDQGYAVLVYTTPGTESAEIQAQDAATVVSLIDSIGEVTLASKTTITSARNLYDILPDSAKALVTNYGVLVNDEAVYAIIAAGGTVEQQPAEEQQPAVEGQSAEEQQQQQ